LNPEALAQPKSQFLNHVRYNFAERFVIPHLQKSMNNTAASGGAPLVMNVASLQHLFANALKSYRGKADG
jgi:hypothetical protein